MICRECKRSKSIYQMSSWDSEYEECKEAGKDYYCFEKYEPVDEFDGCYKGEPKKNDSDSDTDTDCYITTATCQILNLGEDSEFFKVFREFRSNVMRKDEKYHKLLVLYDIVGPKISSELRNDSDKETISKFLYLMIKKSCDLIKQGEYDKATDNYIKMTTMLAEYYGIEIPEITDQFLDEVDIEKSGTGTLVKKKITIHYVISGFLILLLFLNIYRYLMVI